MSNSFTGVIKVKSSKQLKSGMYYSICVEDSSGEESWFRTGKKELPAEKGQMVKFTYTEDKYGKHVDPASLKTKEGPTQSTPAASRASGGEQKTNWNDKDKKIGYMAATKSAIDLVSLALDKEILAIPKSKKQPEKLALLLEYVNQIAEDVFRTTEGIPSRYEEIISGKEDGSMDFDAELLDVDDVVVDEEEEEDDGDDGWS